MKRLFAAFFLVACTPAPAPAPAPFPDASDAGMLGDAAAPTVCEHLAALGCAEGSAKNCEAVFAHVQLSQLTDLRPACLLAAGSKEAVRACGSVRCP